MANAILAFKAHVFYNNYITLLDTEVTMAPIIMAAGKDREPKRYFTLFIVYKEGGQWQCFTPALKVTAAIPIGTTDQKVDIVKHTREHVQKWYRLTPANNPQAMQEGGQTASVLLLSPKEAAELKKAGTWHDISARRLFIRVIPQRWQNALVKQLKALS